jgi:hypothetical protein
MFARPHRLYVKKLTSAGLDSEGLEGRPEVEWEFWGKCRAEGRLIDRATAGKQVMVYNYYTHAIYADKGKEWIDVGTVIRVVDEKGRVRVEGDLKFFDENGMHIKMMV